MKPSLLEVFMKICYWGQSPLAPPAYLEMSGRWGGCSEGVTDETGEMQLLVAAIKSSSSKLSFVP